MMWWLFLLWGAAAWPLVEPELIPVGSSTAVRISGLAAGSWMLTLQDDERSVELSCTTADAVICEVQWPSAGELIGRLSGPGQATVLLRVYEQPVVAAVTPSRFPISGGALLDVSFASVLPPGAAATLQLRSGSELLNVPLQLGSSGQTASGRTPACAFEAGEQLPLWLSVNGQNFAVTSHNVEIFLKPKLVIGFLFLTSPDDFGWTFQHNLGRISLEERFFGQVRTVYQNHVEEWGSNECDWCRHERGWINETGRWEGEPENFFPTHRGAVVARKMIEEDGAQVIVATSFYYQWDMLWMAEKYPDVYFIHATGWLTKPNLAQTFPKVYQMRYLSGIAMAWYLVENNLPKKVGYLSAFKLGETIRHINAFKLGLAAVDPSIEVLLIWLFEWHNPRKERIATKQLIEYHGIEALTQHTDSSMPQLTARDYGKVGVGYNSNMLLTVGDSVLTSPVLVWGNDYGELVQDVLDGQATGKTLWRGMEAGSCELAPFSPRVSANARTQITATKERWAAEGEKIFCERLVDNKGRVRNDPAQPSPTVNPVPWEMDHLVPGTSCLTDAAVSSSCQEYDENMNCVEQWLLEGVVDSCQGDGPCFLGDMQLPGQCPEGHFLTVPGCVAARAGYFATDELEKPCPPGTETRSEAMSQCQPCLPGSAAVESRRLAGAAVASGVLGMDLPSTEAPGRCELCPPGFISTTVGAMVCTACPAGTFTNISGSTSCQRCPSGTYAAVEGASECVACGEGKEFPDRWATLQPVVVAGKRTWQAFDGAADASSCGCRPSQIEGEGFLLAPDGECAACGKGLRCEGPDAVFLQPGFYSTATAPTSVFRCLGEPLACPGSPPGVCAPQRHNDSLACQLCEDGHTAAEGGGCEPCSGGNSLPVVLVALLCFALPATVYFVSEFANPQKQKRPALIVGIAGGQAFTVLQHLGVLNRLIVVWPRPFLNVLGLSDLVNFDVEVLDVECVAPVSPITSHALQLLVVIAILTAALPVHGCWVLLKHKGRFAARQGTLTATVGSILIVFFISITSTILAPFQCLTHPNGVRTLRSHVTVVCWEGGEQADMIKLSAVALLLPVLFLAWASYVTWQIPIWLHKGQADKLRTYAFLIFRFRPGAHWYAVAFLARNAFIAVAPVVLVHSIQILYLVPIMLVSVYVTVFVMPWRIPVANGLDVVAGTCTLLMVIIGAILVQELDGYSLAVVCVVLFIIIVAAFASMLALGLQKRVREASFDWFLCHHKACTGSLARLVKMQLADQGQQVFLDVDENRDMNQTLEIIKNDVRNVLALLEGFVTSAKCLGELVTARLLEVKIQGLAPAGFKWPGSKITGSLEVLVPGVMELAGLGISAASVRLMLQSIHEVPKLELDLETLPQQLESLNSTVKSRKSIKARQSVPAEGSPAGEQLGVLAAADLDAQSTALVVVAVCQQRGLAANQEKGELSCSVLALVCTLGCLLDKQLLKTLAKVPDQLRGLPLLCHEGFQPELGKMTGRLREVARALFAQIPLLMLCCTASSSALHRHVDALALRVQGQLPQLGSIPEDSSARDIGQAHFSEAPSNNYASEQSFAYV